MGSHPNLDGVAGEWDASEHVREFMRLKRCLLCPAPRFLEPQCNVACAEKNYHVLAPIAQRLRLPDGSVGQVTLPSVMKQCLPLQIYILFAVMPPTCSLWFAWGLCVCVFLLTWGIKI